MKQNILVIGASGTVGSQLVDILRQQGHQVLASTSKEAQTGQVKVDLVTGEGIQSAFQNIDRAFVLCPPGYADQYKLIAPVIQEAKRRGIKKLVLMTAMGANANDAAPFRKAELDLIHSGIDYTIIRPNWFMQNFNTFWIQGIREKGKIFLPAGNSKTSFIDSRDISEVAAAVLMNDKFNGQELDLTGPAALDHNEVATIISRVTGKDITYVDIAPKDFVEGLVEAGLPKDYSEFLGLIMSFAKEGYNEHLTDNVKLVTGHGPRSFSTYAEDYKKYF